MLAMAMAMAVAVETATWAGISAGQQVGVDIGDAYGAATNWTLLSAVGGGANARDLASGNGVPGVTVALSASTGVGGVNDLSGTAQGNRITTAPHTVTDDGAWAYDGGGTTLSLTFAGLDPALAYRIELYSLGTYTPLDTPFINGIATHWPVGLETRALRKSQTTGAIYANLIAVGGTLSIGVWEVNPVISGAILTAVADTPPIVSPAVNPTNWSRTVVIQSTGYAGTSPLPNFPLRVTLDPAQISGFSCADFAPGGRDLRFTDASNTVVLPHEIEVWNSNGVSQAWFRVPSLTSNTVLRAYWGNPEAPALGATNRVWDEGFRGVWHLAGGFADATTNANHGTNSGTVSAPNGRRWSTRRFAVLGRYSPPSSSLRARAATGRWSPSPILRPALSRQRGISSSKAMWMPAAEAAHCPLTVQPDGMVRIGQPENDLPAKRAKQREQGPAEAPERAFTRTVKPGSCLNLAPLAWFRVFGGVKLLFPGLNAVWAAPRPLPAGQAPLGAA